MIIFLDLFNGLFVDMVERRFVLVEGVEVGCVIFRYLLDFLFCNIL